MTPPLTLSLIALAFKRFPLLRPSCALVWGDWLVERDGALSQSVTVQTSRGPAEFTAAELTHPEARC